MIDLIGGQVQLAFNNTLTLLPHLKSGNNLIHPSQLLVMLTPSQAGMIAKAGWSKRDVKEFLFETARHPVERIQRHERGTYPPYFSKLQQVPVMRSLDDVILVVCGAKGTQAMVAVPWGLSRAMNRPRRECPSR